MRSERGQVAVGMVIGAALVVAALTVLAAGLLEAGTSEWRSVAEKRQQARDAVLGTGEEMRPRWRAGSERGGG